MVVVKVGTAGTAPRNVELRALDPASQERFVDVGFVRGLAILDSSDDHVVQEEEVDNAVLVEPHRKVTVGIRP